MRNSRGKVCNIMNKKQIRNVIRNIDYTLTEDEVELKAEEFVDKIERGLYDFSSYNRNVFTQQGKKRVIYNYDKLTVENILCHYLKKQIDKTFNIKYASRSKIINVLFNTIPVIKDMNDFVIVRIDFKSFFDSVKTEYVYEKYIRMSLMQRIDKEILEEYIEQFKYCYAGLCLSNGMTEIACRDFDKRIRAKLDRYGVFFYERYVDDMLIMLNSFIPQTKVIELIRETIEEVFEKCPVKINTKPGKFSYISKRNLTCVQEFDFLGYDFNLIKDTNDKITFKYGIAERKIRKYTGIVERAFAEFKRTGNIELFRQRLKIYSSRVVIARAIGNSSFDWLTKGVVANYNELRYHVDDLKNDTETFLKNVYFDLLTKYSCSCPYFLKQSRNEESIYNLYSNMKRNRTLVFEKNIGVKKNTILEWIRKIDPMYSDAGKDYYRIVIEYLEQIKVE